MGDASMSVEQATGIDGEITGAVRQRDHETVAARPNFPSRIAEIHLTAQNRLQKITQLLNLQVPQEEPQKPVTPDDVLNHLEMLDKEESLTTSEYLLRSRHTLQESTQLKDSALGQKKKLEEQAHPLQADLKIDIDPRMEALNRARGIRKLLVRREKGRLTTQKSGIQGQLAELENQIQAKKQFIDQIEAKEKPVRQKQKNAILITEEALMTTVGQEIEDIRIRYEQLLHEILQDGTVASDIRETYIEQIIKPEIEEHTSGREQGEDKQDEFFKALHSYIDHREEPNIRTSSYRQALDSSIYGRADLAEPLMNREDEAVIKNLVAKIAADNIRPILNLARRHLGANDSRNKLDELIIVKSLGPPSFLGETATKGTFGKEVYKYINEAKHLDWTYDYINEVRSWQGVKYSRKANELFREEIQKQDQIYYSELLDASIGFKEDDLIKDPSNRNFAIRDLKYYPTPDAIRNLVLITGVSVPTDLAREAGRTLLTLSKKPEWKNILDRAEKVYPALSNLRSVLESLKSLRQDSRQDQYQGEYGWYPEIHQVTQDFALSILRDQQAQADLVVLALLTMSNPSQLDLLDPSLNLSIGQKFFKQTKKLTVSESREIKLGLFNNEFIRMDKLLTDIPELEINESNWRSLLMTFVASQAGYFHFSEQSRNRIEELFNNSHVKDFCLNNLRREYMDYLASGNLDQIPFTLYFTTDFIKHGGGAGPLTQIKSLSNFINIFRTTLDGGSTTDENKNTIFQKLHTIENRFDKEKWSNENRTDFYNISSDILPADPNLFSDFMKAFDNLNPSELRRFMREIYPLYGVQLALMEKTDKEGKKSYDQAQLVNLRKDFQAFSISINTKENPLEIQKAKLIREISKLFKDRFGIIKVPKEFTEDNVRSLTNISLYLSNLHERDAIKETELGYYLSLMLNNKWDDFRCGVEIDPQTFIEPKRAEEIRDIMKKRTELNPLNPENLGIPESDIPEFVRILQEEVQNVAVGDIETIDVKLNNVILNLRQLEDPDLYPEPLDKERMRLLLSYGNRKVGAVSSKMYQSLQNPSKSVQYSEDEQKIKAEITRIAQDSNFDLSADNIKKHFQEGIRPLSTIVNMLQFVNEAQAEHEIKSIRQLLQPSQEIIEVFSRLGEEFKPTSGAFALSSDLDYLDNVIVKKEGSLKPNEKKLLVEYTGRIREQVIKLQEIFDKTKDKFSSLKQGSITTNNQLLKDKLDQIDKIINTPTTQQAIVSTMTNNLNTVIENMRECLSCTKKGFNNDTNLTFGDSNKFYLYSQSEGQTRESISDEILFLDPIIHQDGTSEMAFVFDRIYGVQTPTILTNQLETVIKKYRQLKQKYPLAKLSIFVTDSAIATAGLSQDMLKSRIQNSMGGNAYINEEQVNVDIAESAMADHYIEFGGDGRSSGKRDVKGVVIRI